MRKEIVSREQYDALSEYCHALEEENHNLLELLKAHHIPFQTTAKIETTETEQTKSAFSQGASPPPCSGSISKSSPLQDRVQLFMSLFHGRDDVYALRWENKRNGKKGYSPACRYSWVPGVCPLPQKKCHQCSNPDYLPYTSESVERHLSKLCKDVMGIYALQPDDSCWFLAIDLDEVNWPDDVKAVRNVCGNFHIPCSVEKSRSGNGAHIWFFFSEPVPAATARRMGSSVITSAMKSDARLSFASYDRMFPNQDTIPKGGFGNLIALPLQPEAARTCGGSLFIDECGNPYPDQWAYLSSVDRMSLPDIESIISKIGIYPLGDLVSENEEEKPWHRQKTDILPPADPTRNLKCVIADRIYISTEGVSSAVQNSLKRLAAFRNPELYRKQGGECPSGIPRV